MQVDESKDKMLLCMVKKDSHLVQTCNSFSTYKKSVDVSLLDILLVCLLDWNFKLCVKIYLKKEKKLKLKMGLLTDSYQSPNKKKIRKYLIKFKSLICFSLYFAGIAYFVSLAHSSRNNATYFSENALLPGNVR